MMELPIHIDAENLTEPAHVEAGEMMELAHFEAAQAGNINKFPFCDIGRSDLSETFNKVSPSGNSLLHVASKYGHKEMTARIACNFPLLITKKNSEGNTALHLALKGQKMEVVSILVTVVGQNSSTCTADLPSIKNNEGNTALHEALLVMGASKKNVKEFVNVICSLVLMDPKMSYHQNNEGKSPMCLAVESGEVDILECMLIRTSADQNGIPDDSTMRGKSPVHVAIERKNLGMLKIIGKHQPHLFDLPDEVENTPLHWAASVGYLDGVKFLLKCNNNNRALQRNKEGHYPLHLACENGHEKVIKELYSKWPDATELLCNKGQTILHIAAKSGKERVVRFLLERKEMYQLLNKKDKDGNTPFHLAALHGRCVVVATLLRTKISNADIVNHQGQTAYDICKENILGKEKNSEEQKQANQDKDQQTDRNSKASTVVDEKNSAGVGSQNSEKPKEKAYHEMMTLSILFMYHEVFQRYMNKLNLRPRLYTPRMKSTAPLTKEDLNNRINNLLVVAALIVGAAFTGSLQVPVGEYVHDKMEKKKLGRFMFSNLLAMNLALTAALALCLALLVDDILAKLMIWFAFVLLELALLSMSGAFWWAMSIRSLKYNLSHITLDFLNFISFDAVNVVFRTFQTVLLTIPLAPLLIFLTGWEVIPLFIYFIFFCFYYPLYCLRHTSGSPGALISFQSLIRALIRGLVLLFFLLLGIYIIFC